PAGHPRKSRRGAIVPRRDRNQNRTASGERPLEQAGATMNTSGEVIRPSRRAGWSRVLWAVLAVAAGSLGPAVAQDKADRLPPISDRARRVHAAGLLFDGHNDLP